ncbi:MAG: nucleoside transporter C-terminal domain-containing protein [Bacteroidia bacterium]|nr:nucleoside transporter C-terminal domain-containing protein [Bacteroidia bacterium]MDG2041699.1 nucleoside transporter C-terminal domain-containing protein [Bacteroidia bacterium]|tara:strand:+ start:6635 stop:8005 length:1371 start_codon:yes stop_codon:yes gene_type:complete
MEIIRGLLGLIMLVGIAYLFSKHKKNINWKLVITGILIQFVLALLVFKQIQIPFTSISMSSIFSFLAGFFTQLLSFTDAGAQFIFGSWPDSAEIFKLGAEGRVEHTIGYVFAFKVLPTVVFFSALTSLLYYLGILQKIVYGFAWVLSKTMQLSGAESLAAAANIFVGQTEAPLIVKPYISKMTNSEIMCLMTGGMATIAGGVFAAFIGFLGGDDIATQQEFAKHLLTASILSAPAAIVCAKILFPETEKVNQNLDINKEKMGSGPLEAISMGTTDGIKLAVNVAGMILVFLAFIALINYLLINVVGDFNGIGSWKFTSLNKIIQSNTIYEGFNLQMILGYLFAPLAWIIGIELNDIILAGQLLGEKTVINEFIAYLSLKDIVANNVGNALIQKRTVVILTYALCGFSNFASIGIQIGGIGSIAPNQRSTLARLGLRSLIGGTLACLMTATIAGIFN